MDFHSEKDVRACDNIREEPMEFIQSQYSASPKICSILSSLLESISPSADIQHFYDTVFHINTAKGFGLDAWGEILGIKRSISDSATGFLLVLDDEGYRLLLLYKALVNIMDATPASLNRLIQALYQGGNCYVIVIQQEAENEGPKYNQRPMHIRWVFEHFISEQERAVFKIAGTLCKGAGVGWGAYDVDPNQVFGFAGGGWQPFNQGVFDPHGIMEGE